MKKEGRQEGQNEEGRKARRTEIKTDRKKALLSDSLAQTV